MKFAPDFEYGSEILSTLLHSTKFQDIIYNLKWIRFPNGTSTINFDQITALIQKYRCRRKKRKLLLVYRKEKVYEKAFETYLFHIYGKFPFKVSEAIRIDWIVEMVENDAQS